MALSLPIVAAVALLVLAGIWLAVTFNVLVRHRNFVREAWSGVDVQLKRRHNLVPRLVDLVRGYSVHERQVLEEVTRARSVRVSAPRSRTRRSETVALPKSPTMTMWDSSMSRVRQFSLPVPCAERPL